MIRSLSDWTAFWNLSDVSSFQTRCRWWGVLWTCCAERKRLFCLLPPWSQWFLTFSKPEDPQSWLAGPSLSAVICHWSYLLFMFLRVKGNDFGVPSGNQIFHWVSHCEPPMLELSFDGIPGMFIDVRLCDVLINLIILQSLHVAYNPPW